MYAFNAYSRLLSLLVAAAYLTAATLYFGAEGFFKTIVFLLLPMTGIWFPAQMGSYTGNLARHPITETSPALAVSLACWILLLVPLIGYLIIRFS